MGRLVHAKKIRLKVDFVSTFFGVRQLVAALVYGALAPRLDGLSHFVRDKSRPIKAVTSYRTPYSSVSSMDPRLRDGFSSFEIIDHQDQLMIVIAVKRLDVNAGFGHHSSNLSELARFLLVQALNEYLSICDHAYTCSL